MTIDPTSATRSSSESSFLQHTFNKTTLKVYNNILVEKLVFADKKVKGVVVSLGGVSGSESFIYMLSARKEVIVSAGGFQSPQLLMVFGIGSVERSMALEFQFSKTSAGVGQTSVGPDILWDLVPCKSPDRFRWIE